MKTESSMPYEEDAAYREAQRRISQALKTDAVVLYISFSQLTELPPEIGQLKHLIELDLSSNQLTELPPEIGQLQNLETLVLGANQLTELPAEVTQLQNLVTLDLSFNQLAELPPEIVQLQNLTGLYLDNNGLTELSAGIAQLHQLVSLDLSSNQLTELPPEIVQLQNLAELYLDNNPLSPDLAAAYEEEGVEGIFTYLCAQAEASITLNEAKLILVGEGEVGKTSLLSALRSDPWISDRPTTHGIEIKPVNVTHQATPITLNGWDFGGQPVYRPTHQLFFSAPALYLVVWKPREGPQQGFVKEWISLITRREPDAKILVVATHGGPGQRQPDIDRQELIDEFGSDTILGFHYVDSQPDDKTQQPTGIVELRDAIANIAAALPEMGRTVPAKWQHTRELLQQSPHAYLPYPEVIQICTAQGIPTDQAELFLQISNRLGHLVYYHKDQNSILSQFVILKPDWLAKAISFVFDDRTTRDRRGLADFDYLSQLWTAPPFPDEPGYPKELHPVFLHWMERFDLSYKVILDPAIPSNTSLIAQLVPDNRPEKELAIAWPNAPESGDRQQTQICRIVDDRNQFATAEGLFYQLIVRLHKYSLGRQNYNDSIHWQRGMILDNDYNGRAFLEHSGTDIRITVRAAYPERFLAQLTGEVKWLIENFWKGLKCNIMVPCIEPCGQHDPGCGLFDVQKLIESKKKKRNDYPCDRCDEWQSIDQLLSNAPIAQPQMISPIEIKQDLQQIKQQLTQGFSTVSDQLDNNQRMLLSRIDAQFDTFMRMTIDEAKDGPRLFSFKPLDPKILDKPGWMSTKFQIALWCEHSRLPLPMLNPSHPKKGVYEIEIPKEWLVKSAPWLKILSTTLGLVLPIASSAIKLELDDPTYKAFEEQLDFGQKTLELTTKASDLVLNPKSKDDNPNWQTHDAILAEGSMLRQLHHLIKQKDPSFGGLERVANNRREFLWVHAQFTDEY
jgi:C-terminal of Roc, COR, domain/Ras of Complex, Roc, domain of DAPkinase/Leucine rich repeat/Leucine Rich repeats (2 copies)